MSEKTDFKNTDENSENKINKSENLENKDEKKIEKVNLDSVFSKSNLIFLAWFLAIYFIVFFVLKLFLNDNSGSFIGYTFDLIMLVLLVVILLAWYYSTNANDRDKMVTSSLNGIKDFLNKKWSVIVAFIFVVFLYTFGFLLGIPMDSSKPISFSILEIIACGLLIITLFVQFFKYIFDFSLLDEISKLWKKKDEDKNTEKGKTDVKKEPTAIDEVFNISNNLYTYDDAQSICTSYGARLATYDEVENAYNKGAEWCNYGWSDGQMIFFPTQKSTWDKLQKTKDHKNDCGRPGVNGGYIGNPYVKFGVNCYGKKPKASDTDLNRMNAMKNYTYPKNAKDLLLESKVNFWKDNADKLLNINSFNHDKWSQY
jgi:Extracellular link domain